MNSLRPGQTGCLRAGTYYGDVRFPRGGRAGTPITLMSAPGESATIVGRIWIPKGSDHVRVTGLHLDGRNAADLPSPGVNSADDGFVNDDVTNHHTGICFELEELRLRRQVDDRPQGWRICSARQRARRPWLRKIRDGSHETTERPALDGAPWR